MEKLKKWAKRIKSNLYLLYLSYKHPKTPAYAKIFTLFILAYALSPIDLIPDFIPILGYLDDVILLPLGILLAFKMIPEDILNECREESQGEIQFKNKWVMAVVFIAIWLAVIIWFILLFQPFNGRME